jgi:hypothetical protein
MQYRQIVLKEGNQYSLPPGTAPQDLTADTLRTKIEALIGDAREAQYNDETIADRPRGSGVSLARGPHVMLEPAGPASSAQQPAREIISRFRTRAAPISGLKDGMPTSTNALCRTPGYT